MLPSSITSKAQDLLTLLRKRKIKACTAESCTGGLISVVITEIPGSSEVFDRGYVTYSNEAKIELLTVPTFYIEEYGAVSHETAIAMAEGALLLSKAQISIAVTGIAGPDGGTKEKPVGTVFLACAFKDQETSYEQHQFTGDRTAIRIKTTEAALDMLLKRLSV